jgi:AraC-like DNA-binding protein/mannose-6-phosphate isomerase-like protein (cupin superfamily)
MLSSVLSTAAVTGSVAATVRAGEDWGLELAEVPGAAFHAVTSGTAFLVLDGANPLRLGAGDAVLLPMGTPHLLLSAPGARSRRFDHVRAESALGTDDQGWLVVGQPPVSTQIVCASYDRDPDLHLDPFSALPPVVYVPALAAPVGLRSSLALISDELQTAGPGLRTVLDHAVDIVLVQMLRAWLAGPEAQDRPPSWLRGLGDPTTSSALAMLHQEPALPWTVSVLARRLGVSRATLTRRFESEVGQSPAGYLGAWRMDLAARRLRHGDDTVAAIARGVGYRSEYAFNRAFSRHYGTPPGRWRAALRSEPLDSGSTAPNDGG